MSKGEEEINKVRAQPHNGDTKRIVEFTNLNPEL